MNNIAQNTIRIALLDGDYIFRKGLCELIGPDPNFRIVMDTADTDEMILYLEMTKNPPDVFIQKITNASAGDLELIGDVKRCWPGMRVLVLTSYTTEYSVLQMVRNGVDYCLPANCSLNDFEKSIIAMCECKDYFANNDISNLFCAVQKRYRHFPEISKQELEFLKLCCTEYSYSEIAPQMGVSELIVQGYRDTLFEKLKVRTREKLARFAISMGLVQYHEW